jgi:hypothetical protein
MKDEARASSAFSMVRRAREELAPEYFLLLH